MAVGVPDTCLLHRYSDWQVILATIVFHDALACAIHSGHPLSDRSCAGVLFSEHRLVNDKQWERAFV